MNKKKLAIFASGSGTNAENIIRFFTSDDNIEVSIILTNKKDAYVHERAKKLNILSFTFSRQDLYESDKVLQILKQYNIDFIILAGFLWLIPSSLIESFPGKIINIHPALLPKYGGKGMYGNRVHDAVFNNKEDESGITIHYVNESYDEGDIIFQARCRIKDEDTPESIAEKVHELEYKYYPEIIKKLVEADKFRHNRVFH